MMELTPWDYANLVSKFLSYLGVAAGIGGPFIAALITPLANKKAIINYIAISSVVGFSAVIGNFFIQVGAFSEAGLSGMLDTDMLTFLWQSAPGDAVLWRLLAFTTLGLAFIVGNLNVRYESFNLQHVIFAFLYAAAIFGFVYSFTFVGHAADIGGVAKWLIALHIVSMAWWIGALYPLWVSCQLLQPSALYKLMHLFGQIAMLMVGLLLVCGISLLSLLLASPLELLTTQYGQAILLKLTFVFTILLLAAYHKFHLVEEVQREASCHKLQKSISKEMLIAALILAISAVLSSILGPVSLTS